MRRGAAALVVLVALVCAAAARPVAKTPLYGVVGVSSHAQLTRLDPSSLVPLGRRLELGDAIFLRALTPDRSTIVLSDAKRKLLLVDPATLRPRGRVTVGPPSAGLHGWLDGRLVLAASTDPGVVVQLVDLARKRVIAKRRLAGWAIDAAWTSRYAVLVLGTWNGVGRATLAVVDARGEVRTVRLARIPAGFVSREGAPTRVTPWLQPGLAVDPVTERAFVVGVRGPVAEVDLISLAVTYHGAPPSGDSLAKGGTDGGQRFATWIAPRTLAVSGFDDHGSIDASHEPQTRTVPVGVRLLDTQTWAWRTLDSGASSLAVAGHTLLTSGFSWNSATRSGKGVGLSGYALDGGRRFHLFGRQILSEPLVVGTRAFVSAAATPTSYAVVDLEAGKVVRRVDRELPRIVGAAP